jgi:hypothetical protein
MHVEFLTEEPSAEAALAYLVPRLLPDPATWEVRSFQGKGDLLQKLPDRLRAYPDWLPHRFGPRWCVVVLVDRDDEDCHELKARLEGIAAGTGLVTRTAAHREGHGDYDVVNRIVVEELEAWFFGDVEALRTAYPFVSATLASKSGFRDPDDISGGTWERLEKLLNKRYPTGMPKVEVAAAVAEHMVPDRNRSRSFQVFRDAVQDLSKDLAS